MSNKFRENLIESNYKFKEIFNNLLNSGEIEEFPNKLWDVILIDKTSIRVKNEPFAFKDLFHLNLNEGRCRECVFEMVMLFDKLGIYAEAVECINEYFKGTTGSIYGGHWFLEIEVFGKRICIDTSLVVIGNNKSFRDLGHNIIKKYDIDSLFKQFPDLIDYYDQMIIDKKML